MSELIAKVDQDLVELEERLLGEFRRLRKLHEDSAYSELDESLKLELSLTRDALFETLEHSGDKQNLTLRSDLHEQMLTRLDVLRNLLVRKIPAAFIEASHAEVKLARKKLESKVISLREDKPDTSQRGGLLGRMLGGRQSNGEKARNPNQITVSEEKQFLKDDEFNDAGLYSASHELAVLEKLVRLHHIEGQSIDQILKDRAQFRSRDLSAGHASDRAAGRNIAQTPEEIRRKLANRGDTNRGASSFAARDLSHAAPPSDPPRPRAEKREIAQSPEEIRAKLAARQSGAPATKAVFGARDIEPVVPQEFRDRPAQKKEEPPEEKPKGRAVFEAKDLSDPKP